MNIKSNKIYPKYIYYALKSTKDEYGFDRTYRASLTNIKNNVTIEIPVTKNNDFDLEEQKRIATRYEQLDNFKNEISEKLDYLSNTEIKLAEIVEQTT